MKKKSPRRIARPRVRLPRSIGNAAADAQRRLRGALGTLEQQTAGPTPAREAFPRAVVRAQRRLQAARQKAQAAAKEVENEAYDALSVVVRTLKIPMADAGALLGYPYISLELLEDGRWTADIPAMPGLVIHADTREGAVAEIEAQALRAIADKVEVGQLEPGALVPFERGLRQRIDRENQASRDADARDLASGRKTAEELRQQNGFLRGVRVRIDYTRTKNPR